MHCAEGTRHVAVIVTDVGIEPQENPRGEAERRILAGLLLFANSWTNPGLGLQARESVALPDATRFVAVKLMTSGSMVQDALGVGSGAKATDA